MAAKKAGSETLTKIRQLAQDLKSVRITNTAQYDLMAHRLNKADVCQEIVAWIDRGEDVKETTLHSFPGHVGRKAYELKPRLNRSLFYVKVTLVELGTANEHMLVISVHLDR